MIAGILWTILILSVLFAAQGIYRNWDVYRGRATEYDALPDHLNEESEIENAFPDDSQFKGFFGKLYRKFHKVTKPWGAFGPRSKFWWARWRTFPMTLIALRGPGRFRFEKDDMEVVQWDESPFSFIFNADFHDHYLSRIQYYCRWHIAVQWPLQISAHWYWRDTFEMPKFPNRPADTTIKDMIFVYGPIHRDGDVVYWLLSFFIGGAWK